MNHLKLLLEGGILLLLLITNTAFAADYPPAAERHVVELQRNRDDACTQCHKVELEGMHGVHSQQINPNNNLPITCTNCHGNVSPDHRNGVKDVMRFNQDLFKVEQQNSVCLSCHEPEKLRQAFWQHDVHYTKESCAACHQVHPNVDPMKNLDSKQQIKLCVDCHSELRKEKELP